MQRFLDLLSDVDPATWGMIAMSVPAFIALSLAPHFRKRWHAWRLERRLAKDPLIHPEELAEFNWKIDEELEPVDWSQWSGKMSVGLALFSGGLIATDLKYDLAWEATLILIALASLMYQLWRKLNDPEELYSESNVRLWDRTEFPPEAIYGFIGGIAFVALVVLFVTKF